MEVYYDYTAGGVQWLTVGTLKDRKGKVDDDKLLSMLRTMIRRVDRNTPYQLFSTVKEATDYFQEVCYNY